MATATAKRVEGNVTIQNTRIIFRNFSGKQTDMNVKGNRNFCVVLTEEQADELTRIGWSVKSRPPREEGDEALFYIPVKVSYPEPGSRSRPPQIVMINSRGRTTLDEESVDALDWVRIKNVDVIFRPYNWAVNGNTGVKAYAQSVYVTVDEDELELKYSGIPEAGVGAAADGFTYTPNEDEQY